MSTVYMASGGVTDTTARMRSKVTGSVIRFAVADNADMTDPTFVDSVVLVGDNNASAEITGLTAGTRYWWQVEDGGVIDTAFTGQFLTDPVPAGTQAPFYRLGFAGDSGLAPSFLGTSGAAPSRLSNAPIHTTIAERAVAEDWARFIHLGDICYYDLGSGNHGLSSAASVSQYRGQYADVFAQDRAHEMLRSTGLVYTYDDHDYGPNNSSSTAPGRNNVTQVYRATFPTYDMPGGAGANPIYQSFIIGRVLHVLWDCRADKINGSTMLGAAQLAWFDGLLENTTAEALIILSSSPWVGNPSDAWPGFTAERETIAGMIDTHGFTGKTVMLSADLHANAIMTPSGNPAGTFPNWLGSSLDATPSASTGVFDGGYYNTRQQYGTVDVHDMGEQIVFGLNLWRGNKIVTRAYYNAQL